MAYERTELESLVADELRRRNLPFVEQYPTTSGFVLDFVLSPNIVLEADGPCHDSSKSKRRDRFRDKILKTEGWRIYRLSYEIISNPEHLSAKISEIFSPLI